MRARVFSSTVEPKPYDQKQLARFMKAKLAQLNKWHKRREARYEAVQLLHRKLIRGLDKLDKTNLSPELKKATEKVVRAQLAKLELEGSIIETYLMTLEGCLATRMQTPMSRAKTYADVVKTINPRHHHKFVGVSEVIEN